MSPVLLKLGTNTSAWLCLMKSCRRSSSVSSLPVGGPRRGSPITARHLLRSHLPGPATQKMARKRQRQRGLHQAKKSPWFMTNQGDCTRLTWSPRGDPTLLGAPQGLCPAAFPRKPRRIYFIEQGGVLTHGSSYRPRLPTFRQWLYNRRFPWEPTIVRGFRPRLQRRDRDGFAPSSLLTTFVACLICYFYEDGREKSIKKQMG